VNLEFVGALFGAVGGICGVIWAASQLVGRFKRGEKDLNGVSARGRADAELAHRRYFRQSMTMMTLCQPDDREWLAEILIEEYPK
jgi:hypothetical protein